MLLFKNYNQASPGWWNYTALWWIMQPKTCRNAWKSCVYIYIYTSYLQHIYIYICNCILCFFFFLFLLLLSWYVTFICRFPKSWVYPFNIRRVSSLEVVKLKMPGAPGASAANVIHGIWPNPMESLGFNCDFWDVTGFNLYLWALTGFNCDLTMPFHQSQSCSMRGHLLDSCW